MHTLLWYDPTAYDHQVKCPVCGEPCAWHILLGKSQPVPPREWHGITEGRLRPSDLFPEDMGIMAHPPVDIPTPRKQT